MPITEVSFSGNSRFASDFRQLIDRAVAIAALPLSQLESQRVLLGDRQIALQKLDTRFEGLRSTVDTLASATQQPEFNTTITNGSAVSAQASEGAFAGVYVVDVVDVGSSASALSVASAPTVADPLTENISAASQFTLVVDGESFVIDPDGQGLSDLADAINLSGAGVQATILNVGPTSAPDYRLSIQSNNLGPATIQLNDGTIDLLQTSSPGTNAQYTVNGQPATPIESSSRTVSLGPGLTADLLSVGQSEIHVAPSSTGLSNAVADFVAAFNLSVDEISLHRGDKGGVLSGESLLSSLQTSLRSLASFEGDDGGVSSLADIGVTFNSEGKLVFDQSVLTAADTDQVREFLGDGAGGLAAFAQTVLDGIEQSDTGILDSALSTLAQQIKRQDNRIVSEEVRITSLAENLQERMATADAVIASLEQQVIQMSAIFESIRESRNQN